jgi:effector-binding domain-containing protein
MKKFFPATLAAMALLLTSVLFSCSNHDEAKVSKKDSIVKPVRVNTTGDEAKPAAKSAIINIVDTVSPKRMLLYMKDSAKSFERIGIKLGAIYGVKLADVLKKNNIKMAGAPMAWYKSQKAPYFFEAGLPVNKKPAKLPKNVFIREMAADSVMMAHFYGPYELLGQGYDAIKERMKDKKRSSSGAPYEIYVGDPVDATGKPVDPYKVRTDIIFPRK